MVLFLKPSMEITGNLCLPNSLSNFSDFLLLGILMHSSMQCFKFQNIKFKEMVYLKNNG